MESKLPKPSNLKFRNIIPSVRLVGAGVKTDSQPSTSSLINGNPLGGSTRRQPLKPTVDFFNLPPRTTAGNIKKRHASPELHQKPPKKLCTLRRSKSFHELREKPTASTVANIKPTAKMLPPARPIFPPLTLPAVKPKVPTQNIIKKPTKVVVKSNIQSKSASSSATSSTKSSSSSSSSSSTGMSTAATRRIPPYDYKARFNDLSERHKMLKSKHDSIQEELNGYSNLSEEYEVSQAELLTATTELKKINIEYEDLKKSLSSKQVKIDVLSKSLVSQKQESEKLRKECEQLLEENQIIKPELNSIREKFTQLQKKYDLLVIDRNELYKENIEMKPELLELRTKTGVLSSENIYLTKELNDTSEMLFKSNYERKELHNVVMDLRGNIRVFCRVRPPLDDEETRQLCGWQYLDETSLEISSVGPMGLSADCQSRAKQSKHEFSFDQIFHPRSSQEDIFELVSPLIQSALDGYNVCIFAYGQTGSGKTYTMDGVSTNIGIIPRTTDLLFDCVHNYKRLGWEYEIRVTFLEIYNETLYDLLSNEQKELEIRMVSAKNRMENYVSNITIETVENPEQLRHLMQIAKENRATASTIGNERSSRSHAVTRLELIGTHSGKSESCIGTINLVDLAGSESPKTSQRMDETKKINKSLSELTNVIMALLNRQEHIPYRNSKLTHLLMPCLGGNSKTLMFINVSPFQDCFNESVKSLRFASSVNACKMTKVKKNKHLNQYPTSSANNSLN